MEIDSRHDYPSCSLSNFSPHPFTIDGVLCNSMEGFLQSLKFSNPDMQEYICSLIGREAKSKGSNKKWYKTQTLYWKGKEYKRDSEDYQHLLNRVYMELYKNTGFKNALHSTGNAVLEHSIGKIKQNETILTRKEFCSRLTKLRNNFGILE